MRVILYHYTKDIVWIKTLPESQPPLGVQSIRDRMIDEANLDFEQSQTYLDRASNYERRAQEQRQKALDIQKSAVYRALQACNFSKKEHKQSSAAASQTVFVDRSQFFAIFDIDSSSTKPLNISFHVSSER